MLVRTHNDTAAYTYYLVLSQRSALSTDVQIGSKYSEGCRISRLRHITVFK